MTKREAREGIEPVITNASVACLDGDRVLLIRRSLDESSFAGFWEFPGGSVELGETPAQAAAREFREECGADVIIENRVATFSWTSGGQRKTEVVFAGQSSGPITLGRDHCSHAWVGLDDLVEGRFTCSSEVRSIALNLCRSGR
ncbi:MAG: NUDIX hydrolase [Bacillota bacterium]